MSFKIEFQCIKCLEELEKKSEKDFMTVKCLKCGYSFEVSLNFYNSEV